MSTGIRTLLISFLHFILMNLFIHTQLSSLFYLLWKESFPNSLSFFSSLTMSLFLTHYVSLCTKNTFFMVDTTLCKPRTNSSKNDNLWLLSLNADMLPSSHSWFYRLAHLCPSHDDNVLASFVRVLSMFKYSPYVLLGQIPGRDDPNFVCTSSCLW